MYPTITLLEKFINLGNDDTLIHELVFTNDNGMHTVYPASLRREDACKPYPDMRKRYTFYMI